MFTWSTAPAEESEFTGQFAPNVVVRGEELTVTNPRFTVDRFFRCEVTNMAGNGSNIITLTG